MTPKLPRTQGRMTTGIERKFRRDETTGYFREVFMHFICFIDEHGNKTQKLDKIMEGKLYKVARPGEKSMYGEAEYTFPDSPTPVRLVCLGDK